MAYFFAILSLILLLIALFLWIEHLKKFRFMKEFTENSNQMAIWNYVPTRKPWMRNVVLRGEKPFCVLIGFMLEIPLLWYRGFDYYWFAKSDGENKVVISTFVWKKPVEFRYFINADMASCPIAVSSEDSEQAFVPTVTYPPHWWQKIGFFG